MIEESMINILQLKLVSQSTILNKTFRYAMDPVVILDIITWKVPYFISTICKAIFIPYYMVFLNWKLTVLSLTLLAFLQLIQIPILKVSSI